MTKKQLRSLKPGDKVLLSDEGRKYGLQGKAPTILGYVQKIMVAGGMIQILRHGMKTAYWYSRDFWILYKM